MNISGNYNTTDREVAIVKQLFDMHTIPYKSISKHENANDGDVLVVLPNDKTTLIEVKEETYNRFCKYGDLGIDYISAFDFKNPEDATVWKNSPKSPRRLESFLSSIHVKKYGKLLYSKSDLWLFFVVNPQNQVCYYAFFDGHKMTCEAFRAYLCGNCLFAVNNKPTWQLSNTDSHQSACFFIHHTNAVLNQYKVDLSDYVKKA